MKMLYSDTDDIYLAYEILVRHKTSSRACIVNLWFVSSAVRMVPSILISLMQGLKYYESLHVFSSIIKM